MKTQINMYYKPYSKLTRLILPLAAALIPTFAFPKILAPDEALDASLSSGFLVKTDRSALPVFSLDSTVSVNGNAAVYIMKNPEGSSLFLSASSNAPSVIGYTDLPLGKELPPAMKEWLRTAAVQSALTESQPYKEPDKSFFENIGPLLTALWSQNLPFNMLTPPAQSGNCPTGCMATAFAQIMHYWKHPVAGSGKLSYETNGHTVSFDFEAARFRYDDMPSKYIPGKYTQSQAEAVAELMLACGVASQMEYVPYESVTSILKMAIGAVTNLKFSKQISIKNRDTYSFDDWQKLIASELKAKRPIVMTGSNDEAGHAFVVDGMDSNGYFHVNWGWGGSGNGYFLINGLSPKDQGTGGNNDSYNLHQAVMTGIEPLDEESASRYILNTWLDCDWGPAEGDYSRKGLVNMKWINPPSLSNGWHNASLASMSISRGIKFVNSDGEAFYYWGTPSNWEPGQYFTGFTAIANPSYSGIKIPDGEYTAYPVVKSSDSDGDMICEAEVNINCRNHVFVKVTEKTITISHPKTDSANLEASALNIFTPLFPERLASLSFQIRNSGAEYYGNISLNLISETPDGETFEIGKTFITLPPSGHQLIEWTGNIPASVTSGQYRFILTDSNGRKFTDLGLQTVENAPAESSFIYLKSITFDNLLKGNGSYSAPYLLKGSQVNMNLSIECTQGYFTDPLYYQIFDGNEIIRMAQLPRQFIQNGVSASVSHNIQTPDISFGKTYAARFIVRTISKEGYTTDKQLGSLHYIAFDDDSSVTALSESSLELTYSNGSLAIVSDHPLGKVSIHSLQGTIVFETYCGEHRDITVSLPSKGIYILHTGNEVRKISIP